MIGNIFVYPFCFTKIPGLQIVVGYVHFCAEGPVAKTQSAMLTVQDGSDENSTDSTFAHFSSLLTKYGRNQRRHRTHRVEEFLSFASTVRL